MYNHIPGNIYLSYKDTIASSLREYYNKNYKDRPHCFNPWEIHPYTMVLDDKQLCKKFIKELMTTNQDTIKWVFKKSRGAHNGKGVFIVDDEVA
mmetsp:Transcript_26963/g.4963  ORF Transcript_26963/g.4963 Transcript_26963/m.4963 type:complete len:94 (+) Transcript_26963:518-799(+)